MTISTSQSIIVITMRNNDPSDSSAQPVRQLLALNCAGISALNVTLSTALERQRPDAELEISALFLQECVNLNIPRILHNLVKDELILRISHLFLAQIQVVGHFIEKLITKIV